MSGPILAGALLALPGFAAAGELRSYAVTGDAIALSLTGAPGDPVRGRATSSTAKARASFVTAGHFRKRNSRAIWPPASAAPAAAGRRASCGFGWSTGASLNPATIMPSYYRVDGLARVGPAWRGKPILSAEQIEDMVAYLCTLRE